jgi:hypothetical protein
VVGVLTMTGTMFSIDVRFWPARLRTELQEGCAGSRCIGLAAGPGIGSAQGIVQVGFMNVASLGKLQLCNRFFVLTAVRAYKRPSK